MNNCISSVALTLLKEWYYWTREANCKSNFPPITYVWEKKGLAWQNTGVGFDISRGTKPIQTRKWEEAGHQFMKLSDQAQNAIIGHLFYDVSAKQIGLIFKIGTRKAEHVIHSGLREYEWNCIDCGLIQEDDEMNPKYLCGHKNIAKYLDVSEKTVQRYVRDANPRLPIVQVRKNGNVLVCTRDLDQWFRDRNDR